MTSPMYSYAEGRKLLYTNGSKFRDIWFLLKTLESSKPPMRDNMRGRGLIHKSLIFPFHPW